MNRQQALRLIYLFPVWCAAACKSGLPSAPTVVEGNVVDENGVPVEDVELTLSGIKRKGVSPIPTFDERTKTDSDGSFELSHVVTSDTDFVVFEIATGTKYIPYINLDGQYEVLSSSLIILPREYGKTKIVNLQVRKP